MKTKSWVIVDNSTGVAVFETFSAGVAAKVNTATYTAVPVREYLQGLNRSLRALEVN
jgi:hypothetical protein